MTEAEWLGCDYPATMLHFLYGLPGDERRAFCQGEIGSRKLRLFACACVRRVWHLLADPRSRTAVEVAERYADGQATRDALATAAYPGADDAILQAAEAVRDIAGKAVWEAAIAAARTASVQGAWYAAGGGSYYSGRAVEFSAGAPLAELECRDQCRLLRCVLGNPFHTPAPPRPAWLAWNDGTVRKLARTVYDERRFGDLPILADALEDAGCADADLLDHLREPGPHARGCWPVDLLLGLG
jgi:hypothetical protein